MYLKNIFDVRGEVSAIHGRRSIFEFLTSSDWELPYAPVPVVSVPAAHGWTGSEVGLELNI